MYISVCGIYEGLCIRGFVLYYLFFSLWYMCEGEEGGCQKVKTEIFLLQMFINIMQ